MGKSGGRGRCVGRLYLSRAGSTSWVLKATFIFMLHDPALIGRTTERSLVGDFQTDAILHNISIRSQHYNDYETLKWIRKLVTLFKTV